MREGFVLLVQFDYCYSTCSSVTCASLSCASMRSHWHCMFLYWMYTCCSSQQVNSSGLVYDGRLVVDLNFRTADSVSTATYYICIHILLVVSQVMLVQVMHRVL
jgi:hypothetical protein